MKKEEQTLELYNISQQLQGKGHKELWTNILFWLVISGFAVMCVIYLKLHSVYSVTEKTSKYIVTNEIQMFLSENRIIDKEKQVARVNPVRLDGKWSYELQTHRQTDYR